MSDGFRYVSYILKSAKLFIIKLSTKLEGELPISSLFVFDLLALEPFVFVADNGNTDALNGLKF